MFHWLSLHRMMAVSGRVTALIDRLRHGSVAPATTMSPAELIAAIQSATELEFGPDAAIPAGDETADDDDGGDPADKGARSEPSQALSPLPSPTSRTIQHVLFFFGLILGGAIAAFLNGGPTPTYPLRSVGFDALVGGDLATSTALLGLGGVLVGFGTRMAGGCTSGHGLCGVSRLQPGSLVATLSFFGVGILVSLGLAVLL